MMSAVWLREEMCSVREAVCELMRMMLVEDMLGSCVHDTAGSTSIALSFVDVKLDGAKGERKGRERLSS